MTKGETEVTTVAEPKSKDLLKVSKFPAWKTRGLTAESCRKWGCGISGSRRVFNYRDDSGALVAQKTRDSKKNFSFISGKSSLLYGKHLWGAGGKRIIVTEGEVDAISISQVQGHRWPVVSLASGAASAKKCLQENLEWLQTFETVVLWFDDDSAGREAIEACSPLFKPGTVQLASLSPYKDANEALMDGKVKEVVSAIWQAKPWSPDGILNAKDLWDEMSSPTPIPSLDLPWSGLQDALRGVRDSEVVTIIAGTGAGKSTFVRELASHYLGQKKRVGMLMLEETPVETAMDLVGHELNVNLRYTDTPSKTKGFKKAFDKVCGSGNLLLFDHFGSIGIDNVESRMRYMAKAAECDVLVLDHISMMVSGMEGDERKMLDIICTRLKTLSMEIRKPMFVISHVSRSKDGRGHEEGGRVSMNQIRGTQGIGQLSNVVLGLERDQQSEEEKNVLSVRVLKGRRLGDTGVAQRLYFNKETGRLTEFQHADTGEDDYAF